MSTRSAIADSDHAKVRVTVSVDGRRWRRLQSVGALGRAGADDPVYALDPATGTVRFGDGVHGAAPPIGSLVRVRYRPGGGKAGNVAAAWVGTWPPRPFALAAALEPVSGAEHCG